MRIPLFKREGPKAKDPVCHMDVAVKSPPGGAWEYRGETYYFCGLGCKRAFQKEPEAYLSGEKQVNM